MNLLNYRLVKMIRGMLVCTLLLLTVSLLAQAPQAFKYQAVVRNSSGEPIVSTNVSLRISVLAGGIEGNAIYREIHPVLTSPGGLITLDIGTGIADIGEFEQIVWGLDQYFIKVEVDPLGGMDFIFMGTSQLLSVPYAIYAKEAGGPPSYTWEQLQNHILNRAVAGPDPGMMVFVRDEGKMIYYDGSGWVTTSGECFPPPSIANAGEDQFDVEGTNTILAAESPKFGVGVWSIVSEDNGQIISISDYYDPSAMLETTGGNFVLRWTVTNECGETTDQVNISFCPDNTLANAGDDQSGIIGNTFQLAANVPGIGNYGTWSIVSGAGGSFSNVNNPLATFTGVPGSVYTLRWTIATGCDSNYDDIEVGFCYTLTIANAGPDQINVIGTTTALQGNQPGAGNIGEWTIISGDGGVIENPGIYSAGFYGLPNETYVLRWTLSTDCQESYDDVMIGFCPVLTIANAGPDQFNIDGTTAQLTANSPGINNSGFWAIESSVGPMSVGSNFSDPTIPNPVFSGSPGVTYILSWTISTACEESVDYVTVSFCPELEIADAGSDNGAACIPHTLAANEPGAGNSGVWTVISGTGGSFSNVNNPNSTFSGTPGSTYELAWTISNACGNSVDNVFITFELYPAIANAGPDQLNVEGNSVVLAANTCNTGGVGQWSILTGEGGSFDDILDPNTTFTGLTNGEIYELMWTISTSCYSSEDIVNVSFIPMFMCGDDFVDLRDNKVYPTVQIGEQCWMAANLNVGNQVFTSQQNNGIIEKYCYDHDPLNCLDYGGLYTWNEMMNYQTVPGSQGICPEGWYVPTHNDLEVLLTSLGGNFFAGGKMKEVGNAFWDNNVGATNESGFSSRGGGYHTGGFFSSKKITGNFWSSTIDGGQGFVLTNNNSSEYGWTSKYQPSTSHSVRCIRGN